MYTSLQTRIQYAFGSLAAGRPGRGASVLATAPLTTMLTIDIDSLLAPVSATNPTGDNLEYDSAFLDLGRAAQPKPDQQMGGTIIPGEPMNPTAVFKQATELLAKTKDLRVACYLVQALSIARGFDGLVDGLGEVHGLVDRYWAGVHPQLDPDDNDATMRVTALAWLNTPALLTALRNSSMFVSRAFGPIGLREIAIASGELPQPTQGPKYEPATIDAVFQEVTLEAFSALDQILSRGTTLLHGIEEVFDKQAAVSPDFTPLKRVLQQATSVLRPRIEALQQEMADLAAEQAAAQAVEAATGEAPTPSRRGISGEISSREDVLKMLDKICAYYARYEPSSPLPLLLKRCRRLVPMSFKEIVGDLAPDALAKVELITGKSDD